MAGDLTTLLSAMDRITRQKIRKDVEQLNSAVNQLDPKDMDRTLNRVECGWNILQGTFSIHTTSLSKFQRINSHHSGINGINLWNQCNPYQNSSRYLVLLFFSNMTDDKNDPKTHTEFHRPRVAKTILKTKNGVGHTLPDSKFTLKLQ